MTTSERILAAIGIILISFSPIGSVRASYNDLDTITMNSLLVNDQVRQHQPVLFTPLLLISELLV